MNTSIKINKQKLKSFAYNEEKRQLDFKITFRILYKYVSYFKIWFWISVGCALLATTLNLILIIGMGDLSVLINHVIKQNIWKQNIAGSQIEFIPTNFFVIYAGILIVGYFFNALASWFMSMIVVGISQNMGYRIRMDLFNKVQMLSVKYFDSHESGDIMSVLTNDVYNLVLFTSQNLGQIMYGFTSMLGMLVVMFVISPYISLIVMVLLTICGTAIGFIAKKSGPAFVKQQNELGRMNGFIEEIISGQNIVNLYSQQHTTENKFISINKDLTKHGQSSQSISGLLIPWLNFLMNFIIAIEIAISWTFVLEGISFGNDVNITLVPGQMERYLGALEAAIKELEGKGTNVAYINLLKQEIAIFQKVGVTTSLMLATRNFIQPINQMIGMIAQLQSAVAGGRRTHNLFRQAEEINKEETIEIKGNLKGKVVIKDLYFEYQKDKPILKNINLEVEPGQTIAIVGPTGSGKTTIINLLTKFYDVTKGDIFMDEYNIKQVTKESVRKQVSVVLQDTYLFNATIKENLKYAKPDATDEEIIEATKAAKCHDFIMKLKNQYDTVLTENAQEFSSGQKQLLAIARAMLSPSNILILDEATSNIDTRTEKVVQAAMLKLIENKTSFVIAHRLSTIRNADKIVVLKNGEILEIGNHKELMNKKGFYYNLNMSKTDNLDEEKD